MRRCPSVACSSAAGGQRCPERKRLAARAIGDGGLTRTRRLSPMSAATQRFGERGERVAERWLRRRGWSVLDRRWRSGRRDLDLVVAQGDVVAFVEVKARRRNEFG